MADIRCTLTDLGGQNCDGEEFQPKHPGVLSDKVIVWHRPPLPERTPPSSPPGTPAQAAPTVPWLVCRTRRLLAGGLGVLAAAWRMAPAAAARVGAARDVGFS